VVDGTALEMRRACKGSVGSNPTLSAKFLGKSPINQWRSFLPAALPFSFPYLWPRRMRRVWPRFEAAQITMTRRQNARI
jgi:hypothetical protein